MQESLRAAISLCFLIPTARANIAFRNVTKPYEYGVLSNIILNCIDYFTLLFATHTKCKKYALLTERLDRKYDAF